MPALNLRRSLWRFHRVVWVVAALFFGVGGVGGGEGVEEEGSIVVGEEGDRVRRGRSTCTKRS
jgi:hypothetical protein